MLRRIWLDCLSGLWFLLALLYPAIYGYAQTRIPQESPTLNRSVRALGMGNAFIASYGNEYSAFYNPAALNDIEKGRLKFLNITTDFSFNALDLINEALDLGDSLDAAATDADKIRALDDFVQKNIGSFEHLRFSMEVAGYTAKNFAVGLLIDERMDFSFRDQSFTNFEARNIGDATVYLAFSHGFWDKLLQAGFTLRPTVRFAMNDQITYDTVISSSQTSWEDRLTSIYEDYKFGFAADVGFKSNLYFPGLKNMKTYKSFLKNLKPTIAFTWQDIGDPFPDTKTTDQGQTIGFVENDQSINLGLAVNPDIAFLKTTFEADFVNMNHDVSFMHMFNIGGEFRFPKILSVRFGFHQGYIAAGASLDFKYIVLDMATYAEETGVYGSHEGNRRAAFTLNFGI